MPIRVVVQITCACHTDEERRARAHKVSIDGVGALLDLCPEGNRIYLDPVRALIKKHGRTELAEVPPEYTGAVADAYPTAKNATNRKSPLALARDGKPVGKRATHSGGKRAGAGGPPGGNAYMCPVSTCRHELGTEGGISFHMKKHGITYNECVQRVTACGLCTPPAPYDRPGALGLHAGTAHRNQLLGARKATALALVTAVRRAGDPHGTLKAMDEWIAERAISEWPDSQLPLGEASNGPDDPKQDQPEG